MQPISVPPDVTLRIVPLPRGNAKSRHVDTPTSVLEVNGPQGMFTLSSVCCQISEHATNMYLAGQLTVNLPPYLFTKYDESARKIAVSVGDPTIKHQAAMWGE